MCGIVGFAGMSPVIDSFRLLAMRDILAHRGPDDAGIQLWDRFGNPCHGDNKGSAGLAHRRLSIIDLSAAGHQPMSNEDGDIWMTHNGEFYNFSDFSAELGKKHFFKSRSDSETIIHLYEEFGIEETLKRMNGMFAFAIWDSKNKRMFLARDRLGKKPLFYVHLPNGSLLFASEIKSLLESGFIDQKKIDPVALIQFWTYGYATGERTIFEQIKRLLPGHFTVWHEGKLSTYEYWDCTFGTAETNGKSLNDLAEELEDLLCDSIRLRMNADVPVGLFLSGGIDSSLIASLTATVVGTDVNSFTIGFSHQASNEAPYAKAIAKHLKLSNIVLTVQEDMELYFESIARHFDEPFGDSSALPTYFVSKVAKQHVTVALTGDGGDELFGGYNAYAKALWLWGDKKQRKLFSNRSSLLQKISDIWFRYALKEKRLTVLEMMMSPRILRKILSSEVWEAVQGANAYKARERWYNRVSDSDLLSQMQYVNLKTYLPDDILVKVDRMSMAHALECRCPFLDYRVVEFASRLPYWAKIDDRGQQKFILRHILKKYLPEKLFNRPKMGFSVPRAQWCRGSFRDKLREQWLHQENKYQRPNAAFRLFPKHKIGWDSWQWNAYCSLLFFSSLS